MKRLAIITTHPIQYNAPWFKLLAERKRLEVKAFYTWGQLEHNEKYDPDFGKSISWDIPLLEGYEHTFLKNISKKPGSDHFHGIKNPTIIHELESWNPDALLVFGWKFKSHLKVLRYFKSKKKVLFRGDSNLLDEGKRISLKKIIRRTFLRWIYSHVDIGLYVGSANKDYYLANGLNENQLVFAPHAVDNGRFGLAENDNLRHRLGIRENELVFLFAGKFEPKKNPVLLIRAFINAKLRASHLVLVGNGSLESEMKQVKMSADLSLQNRIHFFDFQNQSIMPAVYNTCDVFVLPSGGPGETWGLAVNEAMACGKAVLVSDKCGCAPDLVRQGENGYIFRNNDLLDLVDKLANFAHSPGLAKSMGNKSLKIIQDWSFGKICEGIEQAII